MRLNGIIWLPHIVDKLEAKHGVREYEVEEILASSPRFLFVERGNVKGEDLYSAVGQTQAGRYLIVYFLRKSSGKALIVSSRNLTPREKRIYAKK
ncbi:MAG: BrnT family toxin [Candidatus Hydrogenedentes bacterium]|nr:BrnT family toxin [Candidatus Hydrogenedentota bacterium]